MIREIQICISPPETFELFQKYPNPFNPTTIIAFQIPTQSDVSIKIFDILGKEIVTLSEGVKTAGYHEVQFNAHGLSSGIYFYELNSKSNDGTTHYFRKKMLMVK